MRKQDQLLSLIKSLTTSEKKYFVQTANADGQDKNYLRLYEALTKTEHYNADELSKQLGKTKPDLANEKKYLEKALLKALLAYHEKNDRVNLYQELATNQILLDKGQNELVVTRLGKLKAKAEEQSLHMLLASFCRQEFDALYSVDPDLKQTADDIVATLTVAKEAAEIESQLLAYDILGLKVLQFQKSAPFNIKNQNQQLTEFLSNPILGKQSNVPTLELSRNHILALLCNASGEFSKAADCQQTCINISEAYPLKFDNEFGYFQNVNNMLQMLISANRFEEAEVLLDRIDRKYYHAFAFDKDKLDSLFGADVVKQKLYLTLQHYRQHGGNEENILKVLALFDSKATELEKLLLPNSWVNILLLAGKLHLLVKQPSRALDRLGQIIHHTSPTLRPAMQAVARVAHIMAHQEMGNTKLLPSLLLAAKRFYKKNHLISPVEELFFHSVAELNALTTTSQRKSFLKQLKEQFASLNDGRVTQLDIMPWINRNLGM